MPLLSNKGKSFQGSIVLGKGFVLSHEQAEKLIKKDSRNKDVIFPYLNGDDLNNDPEQKPSRWVINFFDWDEEKAKTYPDCYEIVEKLVKPERQRWKKDDEGNEIIGTYALRKPLPQKWWIYGEKRPALYNAISELDLVMAINRNTKYLIIDFQKSRNIVFTDSIIIFSLSTFYDFGIMSSSIHDAWAWKTSSTKGSATLRYSAGIAFEGFPFPNKNNINNIDVIASKLNSLRKSITLRLQIGLTELYNLINTRNVSVSGSIINDLNQLRELHSKLDEAVLTSYGWNDILLKHEFYEIDFLPENDRIRFSIHPDARKEILKRLFILNQQLYIEEKSKNAKIKTKSKKFINKDNYFPKLF
ncbi:hypothetical protein M2T78_14380 [Elizabethkingia ursingii]|uniref:type IIL restriction-modification enzyme MmeI n=1 Tax=Elizabethkingia ursingii TaxID=1756150 RepID=UPI002011AEA7|nr:type IIL restriction-modification enzyme MmeI [Elizabethkingia ursingii]MCL1665452.1 hypothetical protein [Elizabethkingia ursingii]